MMVWGGEGGAAFIAQQIICGPARAVGVMHMMTHRHTRTDSQK